MKRKNTTGYNLVIILVTLLVSTLSSCLENKYKELNDNLNYSNFDYKTIKEISVNINTLNNSNQPIEGAVSYTHLDVYKRQIKVLSFSTKSAKCHLICRLNYYAYLKTELLQK